MVSSHVYPGLERKPGGPDNWVEAAGGLPSYIERIAKHLHYERGYSISRAIATAVNTVKRWAKGGTVTKYGTTKTVSPATIAQAAAAVASWEAKKAKGKLNLSDETWLAIDLVDRIMKQGTIDLTAQKCKMCEAPATKKVIWADGRAYQPSCDAHVKAVQDMLKKKNGEMTELAGVQDLSDADIEPTSTMVALMIPKDIASKIAIEGGCPAEDLHITITFNGDTSDSQHAQLIQDVTEFASGYQGGPLKGTIGGIGTFPADDPEKGSPWWVPVDVPGLNTVYEQLAGATEGVATNHGYSPHMTLTYIKDGEEPPAPVPSTPVTFSSVWVVRGNQDRVEIPLGGQTSADLTERATLPAGTFDLTKDLMDTQALAARANRVQDPTQRAIARQAVLELAGVDTATLIDLASTIAPRHARGRAKDGRKSFAKQGKWKHGFVPVSQAAVESKAKGSPIRAKRLKRAFGKPTEGEPPAPKGHVQTPAPIPSKVASGKYDGVEPKKKDKPRVQSATGRTGQRSAGGRKNDDTPVAINEKKGAGTERAGSVGHLRRSKFTDQVATKHSSAKSRKEASKETRLPKRAVQNWDEIPANLKTVRNGKRYVMASFGGKNVLTEWTGGVNESESTALNKRKVMSSITTADAANMSTADLRAMLSNPRTTASLRKQLNAALRAKLAKESSQ